MKILAAILIVSLVWVLLATVHEGGWRTAGVGGGHAWMVEQHDPVVRLGQESALPAGHPVARLGLGPQERHG